MLKSLSLRLSVFRNVPRYLGQIFCNLNSQWVYLVESAHWSIRHDGEMITYQLNKKGIPAGISTVPYFHKGDVLHFGTANLYMPYARRWFARNNRIVLTFFHGNFGLNPQMDQRLKMVIDDSDNIDCLIVSNSIMKARFCQWGFPSDKIVRIPLGVDFNAFQTYNNVQRDNLRERLGIPKGYIVIGSFQKDGNGWGEGLDPKLIKGPDIFCEVVTRLARTYPIHVLLTGPARGYVKQRLEQAGISYNHKNLEKPHHVIPFYYALDMYLMCSREEGGPKSVLESLASGIPLLTTNVGMVPDVIEHGETGLVAEVDDVERLTQLAFELIENKSLQLRLKEQGLKKIQQYSWSNIAGYYAQIFKDLTQ